MTEAANALKRESEMTDAEPKGGIHVALDVLEVVITGLNDSADTLIARSLDIMKPVSKTMQEEKQSLKTEPASAIFCRIETQCERIQKVCRKLVEARKRLEL